MMEQEQNYMLIGSGREAKLFVVGDNTFEEKKYCRIESIDIDDLNNSDLDQIKMVSRWMLSTYPDIDKIINAILDKKININKNL
jgi:hypothetical protein